jgi:hypothetical protein
MRTALARSPVPLITVVVVGVVVCAQLKIPQFGNFGQMVQGQAKFGSKKLAVITGTSSGLGKMTARALLRTGEWHVVGAVRDLDKMELVAEMEEFNLNVSVRLEYIHSTHTISPLPSNASQADKKLYTLDHFPRPLAVPLGAPHMAQLLPFPSALGLSFALLASSSFAPSFLSCASSFCASLR